MRHTARTLQDAFGYLFVEEVDALQELVNMLSSDATVLQIGAGAGTSSLAMLEAREDVLLTTVDIRNADGPYGSLSAENQVVEDAGYADRISQIHGDSITIGLNWGGPKFDMVFVDGDHSYEGCAGDILAWLPHIRSGGIMAVHDYEKHKAYNDVQGKAPHPKPFPELDRAVRELLVGQYEQILHVRSLVAFRVS